MIAKIPLKAARVRAGLKQYEMARMLGVTSKTVWCWETGRTSPDVRYIPKICKLVGLPYDLIDFSPIGLSKSD